MKKGYHSKQWFLDRVEKIIYCVKTQKLIFVNSTHYAGQLFLIQNLNNIKYTDIHEKTKTKN